jgi:hypothetical protein
MTTPLAESPYRWDYGPDSAGNMGYTVPEQTYQSLLDMAHSLRDIVGGVEPTYTNPDDIEWDRVQPLVGELRRALGLLEWFFGNSDAPKCGRCGDTASGWAAISGVRYCDGPRADIQCFTEAMAERAGGKE